MALVYLSLGSNLGDRNDYLKQALHFLGEMVDKTVSESAIYEYPPWGYNSDNFFLNMAVILNTSRTPEDLLGLIKGIESKMGRESANNGYSDRSIDIDIIFYDDLVLESDSLTIPHPLMHKRKFVLEPMSEIAPDKIHPVIGVAVKELYKDER